MGNLNSCCCCGPTNKISDVTIQKRLRRSALHPQIWARRIWSRRTKVHPTEDPDSIVVKKLGKEKLISWVAPGTSTSDLTEETPETPGVSVVGDASLATLTGTSGVSENNVPDKSSVWAWMQKSIPDEEDLWIAKPLADSRGHLPLATPNLLIIAVVGSLPSATVSPAWMKNFVVAILNGLDRHIPQEKQLPTGIQVVSVTSDSDWVVESLLIYTDDETSSDKFDTVRVTVHKGDYFADCEDSDREVHNPSSKKSHQDPV
uniref:uncharacterized protein LOC118522701 isoform X2 n=1 Tax=Halichoerus grypus TaxID=9711 RepID=UPI001658CDE8|nr:uncharacterized protein LOC118522701 isoform X2 [Halichoerus grypus]